MRKFLRLYLATLLIILLWSCVKGDATQDFSPDKQNNQSHTVALELALADLDSTLEMIDTDDKTRSGKRRTVQRVEVAGSKHLKGMRTLNSVGSIDTILYIANFGNDEGYAILGADDRLAPVITITDNGSLTLEQFAAALDRTTPPAGITRSTDPNSSITSVEQLESFVLGEVNNYAKGIIGGGGIIDDFGPIGPPQPDHGPFHSRKGIG